MTLAQTTTLWKQKMMRTQTTTLWKQNMQQTRTTTPCPPKIPRTCTPMPTIPTVTKAPPILWPHPLLELSSTFVRAAEPDSDHVRFDVGVPNTSALMDLVDNKASLYRWDHLMNFPVEGTGVIDLLLKVIIDGTKVCDARFAKFMNFTLYYTTVNLKHFQQYALWYNRSESAKLDDNFGKDFKTRFIESVNPNHATENIRLVNQWKIQL